MSNETGMINNQGDFGFGRAQVEDVPLSAYDLARLHSSEAGANEIKAVMRAPLGDRAWLIDFFYYLCPDRFWLLRASVALVETFRVRGVPTKAGADVLPGGGRCILRGFTCDNGVRVMLPRAVSIVCRAGLREILNMEEDSRSSLLLRLGWTPTLAHDWHAVRAMTPAEFWSGEFHGVI